ncbi:MAG: choice-of-anchor Q domain-containing protein [Chloroflexota bacterium]
MNTLKVRFLSVFMLACLLAAAFPTSSARAFGMIYRVSTRLSITKLCGGSWTRTCGLQQALKLAAPGDQIWVAVGTYKPTSNTDRTISFTLKNGVEVYGGFAGNETTLKQRDPLANVTILSGDIGVRGEITDNSYHVVVTSGASNATTLDGFTITGGTADGAIPSDYDKGAGVLNLNGSPTFRNLIITENYSENYATNPVITFSGSGAGMFSSGNPTIEKVVFSRNQTGDTGRGGGLQSVGNPLITDVTFKDNWAGAGGGLASMDVATLTNVTFSGNGAYNGGGMLNESFTYGAAVLTNVTFNDNVVCHNGAALYSGGDVMLTNVTISGNYALKHRGGGIYMSYGHMTVNNTILWGNTALIEGPQVYVDSSATADIRNSVVEGGCPAGSNCSNIIATDPLLDVLGDHGGSTQTIPLGAGSSAIDTGDDASCPATDQRGVPRPQGSHCDIGAYEAELSVVGPGTYDDTDAHWLYSDFTATTSTGPYLGTFHYSKVVGGYAEFPFTGSQITLLYSKYSNRGNLEVYVDGVLVDTIDQYNATRIWQASWTSGDLGTGVHTVRLVHAGPTGTQVDVDAITVLP